MLRSAAILVALTTMLPASVDADGPRGRVVRVERSRTIPLVIPVLCVQMMTDGSGLCIGPQPKHGDQIVVVDENQVLAEIKVDASTKAMPNCEAVWNITGSVTRGDPTTGRRNRSIGLIDGVVDRQQARRVPDAKVSRPAPDSRVEIGIDRDGDGKADVVVSEATCPGTGGECIEFWTRRANGLERVWSTNLRICR
jgi:hypothetical protein